MVGSRMSMGEMLARRAALLPYLPSRPKSAHRNPLLLLSRTPLPAPRTTLVSPGRMGAPAATTWGLDGGQRRVRPSAPGGGGGHAWWWRHVSSTPVLMVGRKKKAKAAAEEAARTAVIDVHSPVTLAELMRVPSPDDLWDRAVKLASKVELDSKLPMGAATQRARKHCTQTIEQLSINLTKPLGNMVLSFSDFQGRLHPFERVVSHLIITSREKRGEQPLPSILDDVRQLRKMTSQRANEGAQAGARAANRFEADEIRKQTLMDLEKMWATEAGAVQQLQEFAMELRKIPVLHSGMPTVVLVGCPNVGKSSIVRLVSSGVPEVANYPFTTRGMNMGHVHDPDFGPICQVVDTPGVLARERSTYNHMEQLTMAAIEHIDSVVVFVTDLSGTAGPKSSAKNQWHVRSYLRECFPDSKWIDVVSKVDLARHEDSEGIEVPEGAVPVSCETGEGKHELLARILEHVGSYMEILHGPVPPDQGQEGDLPPGVTSLGAEV